MSSYQFVDLFAGCGALSLGLLQAGLAGQFAIEKDAMAFDTLAVNLLGTRKLPVQKFAWPTWLEERPWSVDELLKTHLPQLKRLRGNVHLLAGGPPCQGFSFAGRRRESDPRNLLFEDYVHVVEAIAPAALVLENVPGMKTAHGDVGDGRKTSGSYYEKLKLRLEGIGYQVEGRIINASLFGVPQRRNRLIVVGLKKALVARSGLGVELVFEHLEVARLRQLAALDLPEQVSAYDAISDLAAHWRKHKECTDVASPRGFEEVVYAGPRSKFQALMHKHCRNDRMDSMRLAKHRPEVRDRFMRILAECRKGVRMNEAELGHYGIKKHRIFPMDPNTSAPTITTLPDDVLHYIEPRILTVRESARLQSFPDWFRFRGKFTTGGERRMKECPRYTQVGNAVPPLLAQALGVAIAMTLLELDVPLPVAHAPRTIRLRADESVAA